MAKSKTRSDTSAGKRAPRSDGKARPAAGKGTKPIALLGVYFGGAKTPLMHVRVYPSIRKDAPAWSVIDRPEEKKTSKRSTTRSSKTEREDTQPQVVEVLGGGKRELFPLTGADLDSFRRFESSLMDARAIEVLACIPAQQVTGIAVVNTYFLAPTDAGEGRENYKGLLDILWSTNKVLFVQMRRKEAIVRCVIVAAQDALFMWQLAAVGETHKMRDLIEPAAWAGTSVLPQNRALLARMIERVTTEAVADDLGEDPRNVWLRQFVQGQRYAGVAPLKTSDKDVPSLAALAAELGLT